MWRRAAIAAHQRSHAQLAATVVGEPVARVARLVGDVSFGVPGASSAVYHARHTPRATRQPGAAVRATFLANMQVLKMREELQRMKEEKEENEKMMADMREQVTSLWRHCDVGVTSVWRPAAWCL